MSLCFCLLLALYHDYNYNYTLLEMSLCFCLLLSLYHDNNYNYTLVNLSLYFCLLLSLYHDYNYNYTLVNLSLYFCLLLLSLCHGYSYNYTLVNLSLHSSPSISLHNHWLVPYFHIPDDEETENEARRVAALSPEQKVYHHSCEHFKVDYTRHVTHFAIHISNCGHTFSSFFTLKKNCFAFSALNASRFSHNAPRFSQTPHLA